MDNVNSQPAIIPPTVPGDFESKAGASKSDLARALFELLAGAKIAGIVLSEPSPFDLSSLAAQVETLQAAVDEILQRKIRRVVVAGIANGILIVPFQDIGSVNYQVDVAFVSPNTDLPDSLMWSIIEGSKATSQVALRINGNATSMDIEVTITVMDGI